MLHFYLKKNRSFPQTKAFKFTQPSSDTELCCCVKEHHETIYKMWWMWFFYYSIIYKRHAQMSETQIPESLFSLWSFIFEDTSIRATKLLHKSKLNPVVFCERPERSDQKHTQNQRSLEAKQEYEFQKWFYIVTFLYKHHLHKDSHSEVFEVPQSPSLHTYINRQWWFGFTYNIRKYIKCYKTCCSF